MYVPKHFEQPDVAAMHALIRAHPLASLVTLTSDGLDANHIPLHLCASPGPFGVLRGHVARANPVWRDIRPEVEVLAVFHGPDAYVSPSWYPAKRETGRVVPTWNYLVVHAHGPLRVIDDPGWLREHLAQLTAHNEADFAEPWSIDDAPRDYTDQMIRAIVGIEIAPTRLLGKWKASQNHPAANRRGVVEGLRARATDSAAAMADHVAVHDSPPGV